MKRTKLWLLSALVSLGVSAIEPVDGVYHIASTTDLEEFAVLAENGTASTANAVLEADISYSGATICTNNVYEGTFDGQEHTITLAMESAREAAALFGKVSGTVKNLHVAGTINSSGSFAAGIVSDLFGGTLSHCVCTVDIVLTQVGDATSGGLVARNTSSHHCVIEYCVFAGSMTSVTATNCAGIAAWPTGWSDGKNDIRGCLMAGTLSFSNANTVFPIVRSGIDARWQATDCYVTDAKYKTNTGVAGVLTDEQLQSGEACYLLNGAQSVNVGMYQTLSSDLTPVPFRSHGTVYANGAINCDGSKELVYSNTDNGGEITRLGHNYGDDGSCTICGAPILVDDFYQISTPQHLVWFAGNVNSGEQGANALIMADLDMDGLEFIPIGYGRSFGGVLDGGFHTISNLHISMPGASGVGLVGTADGAIVRNLILDSSCLIEGGNYTGLIGMGNGGTCIFSHLGNEGTVIGKVNAGGIVGCNLNNSSFFAIDHCYVTGTVTGEKESATLSGWAYNSRISDCWTSATLTRGVDGSNFFMRGNVNGKAEMVNCWCTLGQVNTFQEDEVASGALTYKMNGSSFVSPVWYQDIEADEHPIWDEDSGVVYKYGEDYGSVTSEKESYDKFLLAMNDEAESYAGSVVATALLKEAYTAKVAELAKAETFMDYCDGYPALAEARKLLEESAEAYEAYRKALDETAAYLEEHTDFSGKDRQLLESYLEDDIMPGEQFANGSASYILESVILDTEEIKAETARVGEMLESAIRNGSAKGTEITNLLQNPRLENGLEGWNVTGRLACGGLSEVMPSAECWAGTFDMNQTLTGLQNGVYEVRVSAAFRPCADIYNRSYASFVYAGQNKVYTMLESEDFLPAEQAVDGKNVCLTGNFPDFPYYEGGNEDGTLLGYAPRGLDGASIHFADGRYVNTILANVTDGELTLGVCSPGTGQTEWTGLGNFRIFYHGETAEAGEAIRRVLDGQVARANMVLATEVTAEDPYQTTFAYSQALRQELGEAVSAAATTDSPEEMMALVERLSDLFQKIYDCKKAYHEVVDMADLAYDAANRLHQSDYLSLEEMNEQYNVTQSIWNDYYAGAYTQQEAEAKKEELKESVAYLCCYGREPAQEDEVYQIADAYELLWFAQDVNGGDVKANAVLTADIEFPFSLYWQPIGSSSNHYAGTFDGQGHVLTEFYLDAQQRQSEINGLFGYVSGTVKNIVLKGEIICNGQYNGMVALANEAMVQNLTSSLTMDAQQADVKHTGGVVGSLMGNAVVERCVFDGTLTIGKGSTDCLGGIVGYTNSSTIRNCIFRGEIMATEGEAFVGGILGYVNNAYFGGLHSCLVAGSISNSAEAPLYTSALVGNIRNYDKSHFGKNFWLEGCAPQASGTIKLTEEYQETASAERMASGEVCYLLNEGQEPVVFFQTIGQDALPTLDSSHGIVYKHDGEYTNDSEDAIHVPSATGNELRCYDLSGRRVHGSQLKAPGLYIVNGKKLYIK